MANVEDIYLSPYKEFRRLFYANAAYRKIHYTMQYAQFSLFELQRQLKPQPISISRKKKSPGLSLGAPPTALLPLPL